MEPEFRVNGALTAAQSWKPSLFKPLYSELILASIIHDGWKEIAFLNKWQEFFFFNCRNRHRICRFTTEQVDFCSNLQPTLKHLRPTCPPTLEMSQRTLTQEKESHKHESVYSLTHSTESNLSWELRKNCKILNIPHLT